MTSLAARSSSRGLPAQLDDHCAPGQTAEAALVDLDLSVNRAGSPGLVAAEESHRVSVVAIELAADVQHDLRSARSRSASR